MVRSRTLAEDQDYSATLSAIRKAYELLSRDRVGGASADTPRGGDYYRV